MSVQWNQWQPLHVSGTMAGVKTRSSRWFAPVALAVPCLVLEACGSSGSQAARSVAAKSSSSPSENSVSASGTNAAIRLQRGTDYILRPAKPAGAGGMVLTAQQAYNAMLHQSHHPPVPIPATITAVFGYLTEDDTEPPANRMPVWGFRVRMGCITTFKSSNAQCDQWTFARATDGKDLEVMDQWQHS